MKNRHKTLDATDRKERFRTGGGPPPPDVPQSSISEAIGSILQKRFDPVPNMYDDDAEDTSLNKDK